MIARFAIVIAALLAAGSAHAEPLTPEAARRFVTGKLFAFNCFDGSRGAGRIYGDGSVIGVYPAVYVIVRADDRWLIQARSSFAP